MNFSRADLPVNMDVLISGAILADVGKLLEYELDKDGKAVQGKYGQYLRHPFSGVSLAEECGIPPEVCHIIAAHAHEGDLVKRTTEAYIVHHADFMTFLPFKSRLIVQPRHQPSFIFSTSSIFLSFVTALHQEYTDNQ